MQYSAIILSLEKSIYEIVVGTSSKYCMSNLTDGVRCNSNSKRPGALPDGPKKLDKTF